MTDIAIFERGSINITSLQLGGTLNPLKFKSAIIHI